jgi:glycosyltransferase involved in cell wall biosynthesis
MGGAEASLAHLLPPLQLRGIRNVVLALDDRSWPNHEALRAAGVVILPAPARRLLDQVRATRSAIREFQPDLVHSCLWRADLVARLASWGRRPLLCSVVNAQYSDEAKRRAASPLRLEVIRRVDGFMARHLTTRLHAITAAVARAAADAFGMDEAEIIVVPRGRSVAELTPADTFRRADVRAKLGVGPDQPLIVNVARHEWQKGPEDLVDVMCHVVRERPGAVLLQMGRDGNATDVLRDSIERRGLSSAIGLLGVRDDVPAVVSAADVFLFTSRWEGLGGAVLEAMAVGTPVAAYAVPAVQEVLGGFGRLAPVGDTVGVARCVVELLDDPEGAKSVATAARLRFEQHFALDAIADATVDMYVQVTSAGDMAQPLARS